jgi:thiamine-phosphate pyrophosphorylase
MKIADGRPLIYLISDGSITEQNYGERSAAFLQLLSCAVDSHIPLVQIREKGISARRLFELSTLAVALTKESRTKLLINDRADIALAARADGVHLTTKSVAAEAVRKFFPESFIIGVSTHSIDQVQAAVKGEADFAVYGPIFDTPGKPKAVGEDSLREAASAVHSFPVLGLGGVDRSNYKQVLKTGAAGFAAIRFLNNIDTLRRLREEFEL